MFYIGCHLSCTHGYFAMGKQALQLEANTFQFFTRNPRGAKAKAMDYQDAAALCDFLLAHKFGPILAHAPYTVNPCSLKAETRQFAKEIMADDLRRMEYLPGNLYNFHPGSHTGQGLEVGIAQIIDLLNEIISPKQSTTVLLETMAGKGTEVGATFTQLAAILQGVEHREKMGICLDTCHIYDGGYDLVNELEKVLADFDRHIGLSYLKAIHLNDSLNELGCHKDRHQKIGKGNIGLAAFAQIINNPYLRDLPFYLETPNDLEGYAEEIALLKSLRK